MTLSIRWRTGLLVAAVASLVLPSAAVAERAHLAPPRADSTAGITVLLDELTPAVPRSGGTLVLRGRVRNASVTPSAQLSLRLLAGRSPLGSRTEVAPATTSSPAPELRGVPGVDDSELGLVAGQTTRRFTISVPLDDLGLKDFGVYPIGVEVRSSTGRLAGLDTFLPWVPTTIQFSPTSLAWLWPVLGQTHRRVDGTIDTAALVRDVAPGGALGRLVPPAGSVGANSAASLVLDPAVLEEAATLRDSSGAGSTPSPTATAQASATTSSDSSVAAGWLTSVSAAAHHYLVPYADPDLVGVVRSDRTSALQRAVVRGHSAATTAGLDGQVLAWPVGGLVTDAASRAATPLDMRPLVLSESAMPPTEALTYTPSGRTSLATGNGQAEVLLADQRLSELVATRPSEEDPELTAAMLRQRFLADTAMITAQLPGTSRTVVVAPDRRWDPDPALARSLLDLVGQVPWLAPTTVPSVVDSPASEVPRAAPTYPDQSRATELPQRYLLDVAAYEQSGREFIGILTKPDAARQRFEDTGLRLRCSALRPVSGDLTVVPDKSILDGYARSRRAALVPQQRAVAALLKRVRIVPSGVTLGARDGPIPITIVNDLDQDVTVRVSLRPELPRLVINDTPGRRVAAGRRTQVNVSASAVANGPVALSAQLLSQSDVPYGAPVPIEVRIQTLDALGFYLTGGGLLLLVIAIVLRARRRRSKTEESVPS